MLKGFDASAVGFNRLATGQQEISGKSIRHVDQITEMPYPIERLL